MASITDLSILHWLTTFGDYANQAKLSLDHKTLNEQLLAKCLTENVSIYDAPTAAIILRATQDVMNRTITAAVEETWDAPRDVRLGKRSDIVY